MAYPVGKTLADEMFHMFFVQFLVNFTCIVIIA